MMEKQFMPELDQSQRLQVLEANADKVEVQTYYGTLTQDQVTARRYDLTENAIKLAAMEEEHRLYMESYKEAKKPMVAQNKQLLQEIRSRQTTITGKVYFMADHENKMMELYDANGELLSARRLMPDEYQARMRLGIAK